MPDCHAGASCVIGFTADLGDKVIPNIVGVDIGCGMLTLDWKELRPEEDDYIYLVAKLDKYGLKLSGKTTDHWNNRGEGIQQYLESHPEIDEYVILDDHIFDFRDYPNLWERLLITNGIERAEFASKSPAVEAIIFRDYMRENG